MNTETRNPKPETPVPIQRCRISGSTNLVPILDLGMQALTGVFQRPGDDKATLGPVELVFCPDSGLVQLRHDYPLDELYGDTYGYRSGLNASMAAHLRAKVEWLRCLRPLSPGDTVIDIGSNDGTLLNAYPPVNRIGFDPTGPKFARFYGPGIRLVPEFFAPIGGPRAAIITSIAMLYDLPDPAGFVLDVADMLAPDGIWHFEQSWLPAMLRTGSYDTVVVEHLEYYSLSVVKSLLEQCGLRIMDVQTNSINGGSFAVTACHARAAFPSNRSIIEWLLEEEAAMQLHTLRPYLEFAERAGRHRDSLVRLVRNLRADGKVITGCGASTKGNCLLQFCGFTPDDIVAIADVNPDKHGGFTPGTRIPIVSEEEARAMRPDFMLVPVWHFRTGIMEREKEFLARGGRLIFPFPYVDVVG